MLRLDVTDGGAQKYFTYFTGPSDVRRTSFMVWKDPDADDSRWIYIPALDLVKRISAKDKGSSFVGSDFTYEDVSGRHWTDDTHELLRKETVDGRDFYVIQSVPKEEDDFARKLTWVNVETMLPEREEYYDDKDELTRVFKAEKIETIDDIPTVTERSMENVKKGSSTIVAFSKVEYDVGIDDNLFTERYLKAPPKKYISE
jgi:outer membrane lipoprotein-sorting protein